MPARRLGALPPKPDRRRLALAAYLPAGQLPPPPAESYRTGGITDWGLMGNDQLGDCTVAGIGHLVMGWSHTASGTAVTIPDADIQTAYSAVSGYNPVTGANDNGALLLDALDYHRQTGIGGNKNTGYAALDLRDPTAVRQAVYLFGGAYAALRLPDSAMQQTDAGQAWTVPWFSSSLGGHCVPILSYSADWLWCITWGKIQGMTWDFFARFFVEAYAVVDPSWLSQTGTSPTGLNLSALQSDLSAVGQPVAA